MKKSKEILLQLMKLNGYVHSKSEVLLRFLSDPGNDVVSISNTLDFFKIDYLVAEIPKGSLDQLPRAFIGQLRNGHNVTLALIQPKNRLVHITLDEVKKYSISKDQFLKEWSGFVIAVEKRNTPLKESVSRARLTFSLLLLISALGLAQIWVQANSVFSLLYLLTVIVGGVISVLIVQEKMKQGTASSKFCVFSTKTDCSSVLNSREAIIYKYFDLSDCSLIYFSFLVFGFFSYPINEMFLPLSALGLPIL